MYVLSFNGETYTVDHAVRGADFIHGYNSYGTRVVAFDGVTNFDGFDYTGEFMSPESCAEEECNDVKCVDGKIVTADGTPVSPEAIGALPQSAKIKAGFILPLATNVVPDGFLLCDGKAYSRTEYAELFAAIGTTYGSDSSSTFKVPDLKTRVPVGAGTGYNLGATGGSATHTLTVDEMPNHRHSVTAVATTKDGKGVQLEAWPDGDSARTAYTDYAGGGQAHNNMQPYTVVNYVIATGKGVNALAVATVSEGGGATINDNVIAGNTTWSSKKIAAEIAESMEIFIAEYGVTTFAEMDEARNAGKLLFLHTGRYIVPMYDFESGTSVSFYRVTSSQVVNYYRTAKGTWNQKTLNLCDAKHKELENQIQALEERIAALESASGGGGVVFYLNGIQYEFEQGMTWERFVASKYNPTFVDEECCNEEKSHFGLGYYREDDVCHTDSCCGPVNGVVATDAGWVYNTDEIIADCDYYTINEY